MVGVQIPLTKMANMNNMEEYRVYKLMNLKGQLKFAVEMVRTIEIASDAKN